ncbi:MAG: hypothetical protein J6T10_22240 [Methanobrevibacter sp.]|nr:hypothetical protein [Methanobrevibacter sp.]
MDATTITTLISSFGFPILACIGIAWYVKYQMDEYNKQILRITEEHKLEIANITTALNNNTLAIEKLCEKFN